MDIYRWKHMNIKNLQDEETKGRIVFTQVGDSLQKLTSLRLQDSESTFMYRTQEHTQGWNFTRTQEKDIYKGTR